MAWTWVDLGPDWQIAVELKPGLQHCVWRFVPSTYNYFGPHHYFAATGMWSARINLQGKEILPTRRCARNYLVRQWHFRPFRLPPAIFG